MSFQRRRLTAFFSLLLSVLFFGLSAMFNGAELFVWILFNSVELFVWILSNFAELFVWILSNRGAIGYFRLRRRFSVAVEICPQVVDETQFAITPQVEEQFGRGSSKLNVI